MTHYVCSGDCGGVSATPGTCQDVTCTRHNEPLQECNCSNPEHLDQLDKDSNEEEQM